MCCFALFVVIAIGTARTQRTSDCKCFVIHFKHLFNVLSVLFEMMIFMLVFPPLALLCFALRSPFAMHWPRVLCEKSIGYYDRDKRRIGFHCAKKKNEEIPATMQTAPTWRPASFLHRNQLRCMRCQLADQHNRRYAHPWADGNNIICAWNIVRLNNYKCIRFNKCSLGIYCPKWTDQMPK